MVPELIIPSKGLLSFMRFLLPFLFILSYSVLNGQKPTLFDSLSGFQSVRLKLTYPFDSLYKTNNDEIESRISIETDQGILLQDAPLTINLRGKFRRMKCTMPPLLLNFKKSTLKELSLADIDELKLVTHCVEGDEGIKNLEEERLLYQVYEAITPLSYRTIWVNVIYCDSHHPDSCISTVGFILEPDKNISRRLGIHERKMYNLTEDSIHYNSYANAAAFNFLIGNRDWSVISSRNAKLFFDPDLNKYIVIPYDFDYANIVGASYRRESLPKSMTHPYDRIYQGEYFRDQAGKILKSFYSFEQAITKAVHSSHNPIDTTRRKKICRYFNSWFDTVRTNDNEELGYGCVIKYRGEL